MSAEIYNLGSVIIKINPITGDTWILRDNFSKPRWVPIETEMIKDKSVTKKKDS
jgi:hypothetical protein